MFEVSIATQMQVSAENEQYKSVPAWPVVFENIEVGQPDSTCAKIRQSREVAQELANALNATLTDFLAKLETKDVG